MVNLKGPGFLRERVRPRIATWVLSKIHFQSNMVIWLQAQGPRPKLRAIYAWSSSGIGLVKELVAYDSGSLLVIGGFKFDPARFVSQLVARRR